MSDEKIVVKPELNEAITDLCQSNSDINLISLCTSDGFSIKSVTAGGIDTEADKLAAMSSTIGALSGSSAKQILNDEFSIAIVEAASGNMLFVSTSYLGTACVLTLAAKSKMALATARYKTRELAAVISKIS